MKIENFELKTRMKWVNFLHIYQPINQQQDVLEAIVQQSYRPILQGLKKTKNAKITLNINGSLTELFDKYGYHDLIDLLRELGSEGKIEFTGSAKYHALLPFLNEREVTRQIVINTETNRYFLGEAYVPKGFFPPEMAYTPHLAPLIAQAGFSWVILDEIALNGQVGSVDYTKLYLIKGTALTVLFRERRVSNLIMGAVVRSTDSLVEALRQELSQDRMIITGMDGETFGHHRPGFEQFLLSYLGDSRFHCVTVSELLESNQNRVACEPVASTWASSAQDVSRTIQFISWADPNNAIHSAQKEFVDYVTDQFYQVNPNAPIYEQLRSKMDAALASDHFFWASAKPWWSLEMIVDGAYRLLEVLKLIPNVDQKVIEKGRYYYETVVSTALEWKSNEKIGRIVDKQKSIIKIPFKERTLESNTELRGDYEAFIELLRQKEREAAQRGEYEAAILWRDALYKLDNKLDIYDVLNVIDLFRMRVPNDEIDALIEKYRQKYRMIRGGQPEQRE